ncbi:tigger transposable element-derived protein 4-like [Euwallacea similis]|uniref:tigger transposable element-derived protein 4-like n=1 Tax=Euwallacea similis TaxID=1736056 RepID=UPI00344C03A4
MEKRKLKSLTIKQKLKIIKKAKSGNEKRTSSNNIKYHGNINVASNFKRNKPRKPVNTAVFEWFSTTRQQNLPISGPILKQKALQFSRSFGDESFIASSGWLDKFKKRMIITHFIFPN